MPNAIQIDFIGMCVAVLENFSGLATIGLLDEPRHVHLISYRDSATGLPAVKGLRRGDYSVDSLPRTPLTLDDPLERLPDLAEVGKRAVLPPAELADVLRVRLFLPSGTLIPQKPVSGIAEEPWNFSRDNSDPRLLNRHLTDRTRFVGSTDQSTLTVTGTKSRPIGIGREPGTNEFRIVVMAIDADIAFRDLKLGFGFELCEFQLLYRCLQSLGQIPFYNAAPADPDSPICPQGLLRI